MGSVKVSPQDEIKSDRWDDVLPGGGYACDDWKDEQTCTGPTTFVMRSFRPHTPPLGDPNAKGSIFLKQDMSTFYFGDESPYAMRVVDFWNAPTITSKWKLEHDSSKKK